MEVKRICQWCGKPFMAKKTTTNYCSPQCSKRGYKHRMKERRMEMREFQEMLEVKNKLESQEYFTFSQAARLMGVSRQYVYKLVKEDKLRASRLSSRMSLIRRNLMKFSDQKMNLTLPSIILLNRLQKSTKSTLNGCGPIPGNTMFPKSEFANSIITVKST